MKKALALISATFLCPFVSRADVQLPAFFSDGMVLQRDSAAPIWGRAVAGEALTLTLANGTKTLQQQKVVTGANGEWMVRLKPVPAGTNFTLTVRGKNTLALRDVAFGEVWLASGQSNMELRLPRVQNAEKEIAAANYPHIRMFRVARSIADQPQKTTTGKWESAIPKNAADFTAVGYFFARELHQKLKVPIGLIHASYGGTPAEAWTSRATLKSNPALNVVFDNWQKTLADYPEAQAQYERQMARWKVRAEQARAAGTKAPVTPIAPRGPGTKATPSGLYNGMIAPVVPYGIKGVIWYQGESNTKDPVLYRRLFPALINSWRRDWGQTDLPFLWIQLANFRKQQVAPAEGGWAYLREAQAQTLSLPNTGMAVTIDIGEADDVHYTNKQDAGRRLALIALAKQYGQKIEYSGPVYEGMTTEKGAIRLKFGHSDGGLVAKGGDALKGFAIAGKDGVFAWGDAKIEGSQVVVSSLQVPEPVAVRYSWADNPIGNLYNKAGLLASSFRTDPNAMDQNPTPATVTPVAAPIAAPAPDPSGANEAVAPANTTATAAVPQPTRTLVYKNTTNATGQPVELKLNVFEPTGHKAGDKTPVIVLFFGGGWINGQPTAFFPHCAYFASRGIVAIAPDYRVRQQEGTTPFECVADGKSAIRYVRAHATELGIDPNRIVAGGSSAGGHVAACTGTIAGLDEKGEDLNVSSVPNALVLYNPVIDTSPTGYGNDRLKERWREISPVQNVRPGVPPSITFHGDADKTVPYANAVAFNDAMKQAGNRSELVTLKGVGHGFVYKITSPPANRAVRETDTFLVSLGYLRGAPTLPPPTPPAAK